ncbi:MAG: bifunctional 4-hydroxy-2-oxoglutarate aldolase/2-dehydro-3-deoxy-phosphogluconate aldolase [Streptosporangiaceae bacterium]
MYRWETCAAIARRKVIAIVRTAAADEAWTAVERLVASGVFIVEVSYTTPGAVDVIERACRELDAEVVVGAGTVLDATSARLAVLAGARFLVAPTFDRGVLETGHRYGAAVVPGAGTPTEALAALEAGADLVKLFPASAYGPDGLRDIVRALPQLPVVPTGGVTVEKASAWMRAGAVALGMGSALSQGSQSEAVSRVGALHRALGVVPAARP